MNIAKQEAKLALGTVQFGLPYGVANQQGQVARDEAELILAEARRARINTLDTATAYGSSEAVLGSIPLNGFNIITKLSAVPDDCKDILGWVGREVEASLSRLNVTKIDGLLLHRPEQLSSVCGDSLYSAMVALREQGVVRRIGVSVYSPDELEILCKERHFDLVQAPFSIMDTRLKDSGWLEKLAGLGTKLHVRSVFMQGLLLMSKTSRPKKFDRWASHWALWEQWIEQTGLTPLQACLRYVLENPHIERAVIGVDSAAQFKEIVQAAIGGCPEPPAGLRCADEELLNPSCWDRL